MTNPIKWNIIKTLAEIYDNIRVKHMKSLRTKQILDILERDGVANTVSLAEQFNVSIETIRRDFNHLENLGLIKKVYGGAELKSPIVPAIPSFSTRQTHMAAIKAAMAERAVQYIPDGSVVVFDSGTTIFECAKRMTGKKNMKYICTDIHSATELLSHGNSDVYILGGKLTDYGTSSGMFAKEFFAFISDVDFLVMSAEGADPDAGLSNDEINIHKVKQRCLQRTKKTIILLDHAKFAKRGFYKICDFSDVDILITDSGTPQAIINKIRNLGVTVDVVESRSAEY